jgi:hypothetical protein
MSVAIPSCAIRSRHAGKQFRPSVVSTPEALRTAKLAFRLPPEELDAGYATRA